MITACFYIALAACALVLTGYGLGRIDERERRPR